MRFLTTLLLAVICIVVALFAVSNMDPLTLKLQVLFPDGLTMMASVWILLTAGFGMVLGMLFGWSVGSDARQRHRQANTDNRRLRKQVASLTKLTAAGGAKAGGDVAPSTQVAPKPEQKTIEG